MRGALGLDAGRGEVLYNIPSYIHSLIHQMLYSHVTGTVLGVGDGAEKRQSLSSRVSPEVSHHSKQ